MPGPGDTIRDYRQDGSKVTVRVILGQLSAR